MTMNSSGCAWLTCSRNWFICSVFICGLIFQSSSPSIGLVLRQNIIGASCARFLTVKRVGEHPYLEPHLAGFPPCFLWYNPSMPCLLRLLFFLFIRSLRSRRHLLLENLALRQQLAVLARRRPHPRFSAPDKLFWVVLRRLWTGW